MPQQTERGPTTSHSTQAPPPPITTHDTQTTPHHPPPMSHASPAGLIHETSLPSRADTWHFARTASPDSARTSAQFKRVLSQSMRRFSRPKAGDAFTCFWLQGSGCVCLCFRDWKEVVAFGSMSFLLGIGSGGQQGGILFQAEVSVHENAEQGV